MNIFVGNLSFSCAEEELKKLFEGFGSVLSAKIVMRKEKQAPKSRGFGFVDMPDEAQALAAIAGLSGKEFMGRILDVSPARTKSELRGQVMPSQAKDPQLAAQEDKTFEPAIPEKGPPINPAFRRPGKYKGGRRTLSYMKRREAAGMPAEPGPRRRLRDNPMRWRKREDRPRPWQKSAGEYRPWKKAGEGMPRESFAVKPGPSPRPWEKTGAEKRTWSKPGERPKPWKRRPGGDKPWRKSGERRKGSRFGGRGKPAGKKK